MRLEPLRHDHADALWAASRDDRTWTWLSIRRPATRPASRRVARPGSRRGESRSGAAAGDDRTVAASRIVAARSPRRRRARRVDALPRAASGAPERRDRLDLAPPGRVGLGRQRRGQAPHAPPRVRGVGLPARRAEDRRAQRALPSGDRGARRVVRGDPPTAHARPWRREPGHGLVRAPRRGLAGGAGAAAPPASARRPARQPRLPAGRGRRTSSARSRRCPTPRRRPPRS